MRFIKIYGLQRSGTNYLEWLIRNNQADTYVLVDETGWKHGYIPKGTDWGGDNWSDPTMEKEEKRLFAQRRRQRLGTYMADLVDCVEEGRLLYCIVVKDPYSWYASYARYLRMPYTPVRPEWIEHWCALNRHWYEFFCANENRCHLFNYSNLLNQPEDAFAAMCDHFGLELDRNSFANCQFTLSVYAGKPLSALFDPGYYHDKRYLDSFTSNDFAVFADHLDTELLIKLGFRLEQASEQ